MSSTFDAEIISGELPGKNTKLNIALKLLKIEHKKFRVYRLGSRSFIESNDFVNLFDVIENTGRSDYYQLFRDGATIYPRQFWFVDVLAPPPRLGMNPQKLNIKTASRARILAKKGYKDVEIVGQVEGQFLFHVATGSELVPFAHLELPVCVLPIQESADKYRLIDSDEALEQGNRGIRDWLVGVEAVWERKRGEKAKNFTVYEWLNYSSKLTNQSSKAKFKVLYNASGTYLVACVARNGPRETSIDGVKIKTSGLIADYKTFYWDTDNEDEACYITAFLNAHIIDQLIKPLQSVGDFGERDIVKKVLELPIPRFNPGDRIHKELSELAKKCEAKAFASLVDLTAKYDSIGKIRQEIKQALSEDLNKINALAMMALTANRPQNLDSLLKGP